MRLEEFDRILHVGQAIEPNPLMHGARPLHVLHIIKSIRPENACHNIAFLSVLYTIGGETLLVKPLSPLLVQFIHRTASHTTQKQENNCKQQHRPRQCTTKPHHN